MDEINLSIHKHQLITVYVSDVLDPTQFETKEQWFEYVKEQWKQAYERLNKNEVEGEPFFGPLPGLKPECLAPEPLPMKRRLTAASISAVVVAVVAVLVRLVMSFFCCVFCSTRLDLATNSRQAELLSQPSLLPLHFHLLLLLVVLPYDPFQPLITELLNQSFPFPRHCRVFVLFCVCDSQRSIREIRMQALRRVLCPDTELVVLHSRSNGLQSSLSIHTQTVSLFPSHLRHHLEHTRLWVHKRIDIHMALPLPLELVANGLDMAHPRSILQRHAAERAVHAPIRVKAWTALDAAASFVAKLRERGVFDGRCSTVFLVLLFKFLDSLEQRARIFLLRRIYPTLLHFHTFRLSKLIDTVIDAAKHAFSHFGSGRAVCDPAAALCSDEHLGTKNVLHIVDATRQVGNAHNIVPRFLLLAPTSARYHSCEPE